HVRPPRPLARRVRVAFTVGLLMMDAVRRDPEDGPTLERQRAAEGEEVLHPLVRLVTAVREQAVIRHADAEHAADEVEDERRQQRAFRHEEERGERAHVERGHRNGGDPVQSLLILAPVQERRLHHESILHCLLSEKSGSTITSRDAADCNSCVLSVTYLASRGYGLIASPFHHA